MIRKKRKTKGQTTAIDTWGVPDWRDPSAYPFDPLQDAPQFFQVPANRYAQSIYRQALWRWEFLRRNAEYREDWTRLHARNPRGSEKYGLVFCFPDPHESRPVPLWFDDMLLLVPETNFTFSWPFDLSKPLHPQFDNAKHVIGALQTHFSTRKFPQVDASVVKSRARPGTWSKKLRALDARASGARNPDIGHVLCDQKDYDVAAKYGERLYKAALRTQQLVAPVRAGVDAAAWTVKGLD